MVVIIGIYLEGIATLAGTINIYKNLHDRLMQPINGKPGNHGDSLNENQ